MVAHQTQIFFYLAVVLLRMGGAEGCVPGDLLLFVNEDQLGQTERYTILWLLHKTTHEHIRLYTNT